MFRCPTTITFSANFPFGSKNCQTRYNKFNGNIILLEQLRETNKRNKIKESNKQKGKKWKLDILSPENRQTKHYTLPQCINQSKIIAFVAIDQDCYAFWVENQVQGRQKNQEKFIDNLQNKKESDNKHIKSVSFQQQNAQNQECVIIMKIPAPSSQSQQQRELQIKYCVPVPPKVIPQYISSYLQLERSFSYHQHLHSLSLQYTYTYQLGSTVADNLTPPSHISKPRRVIRLVYMEIEVQQWKIDGICEYYGAFKNSFESIEILHPKSIDYKKYNKEKQNYENSNPPIANLKNQPFSRQAPLVILYSQLFPIPSRRMNTELNRHIKIYIFRMNAYKYVWPTHHYGEEIEISGYEKGLETSIQQFIQQSSCSEEQNKKNTQIQGIKEPEVQNSQPQFESSEMSDQSQGSEQQILQDQQTTDVNEVILSLFQQIHPFSQNNLSFSFSAPIILNIITQHEQTVNLLKVSLNLSNKQMTLLSADKFINIGQYSAHKQKTVLHITHINNYVFIVVAEKQRRSKSKYLNQKEEYFVHIFTHSYLPQNTIKSNIDNVSEKFKYINKFKIEPLQTQQNLKRLFLFASCDKSHRYRLATFGENKEKGTCNNTAVLNVIELSSKKLIYMKILEEIYNQNESKQNKNINKDEEDGKKLSDNHKQVINENYLVQIIGKQMLELL